MGTVILVVFLVVLGVSVFIALHDWIKDPPKAGGALDGDGSGGFSGHDFFDGGGHGGHGDGGGGGHH